MELIVSSAGDMLPAFRSLSFIGLYVASVLGVLYVLTGLGVRRG